MDFLKSRTGIKGLDEILNGGLPKNRPTLLSGNTGSGKTIVAMDFLLNGIELFDEPAVFMSFEDGMRETGMYDLEGSIERNPSDGGLSSMVDTLMMVQDIELNANRTRSLCIMKSRGMAHSHDVHRFKISSKGITLLPIAANGNKSSDDAKRKPKELDNLSTSKNPARLKESSRVSVNNK